MDCGRFSVETRPIYNMEKRKPYAKITPPEKEAKREPVEY
jgi:hypothetical protein